jgi:site-specific recombinase XerD
MRTLRDLLKDYLAMRRSLGFKLHSTGDLMMSFVSFMEQRQADYITTLLALEWANQTMSLQPGRCGTRLNPVRSFARYCSAMDPRTEVPPFGLLPSHYARPTPYLFSAEDVSNLLRACLQSHPNESFVDRTMYCVLGLLSVAGLRISEALNLTLDDIDNDDGILLIRSAKFGKFRFVPMHSTTVAVLTSYQRLRESLLAGRRVPHLFLNAKAARLTYEQANDQFHRLSEKAGLPSRSASRRPHLHDLRHHFAMSTLMNWYRDGQDIEQRLPVLSAFLGHVQISNTYWYLSACPDLLGVAKERLERRWEHTS